MTLAPASAAAAPVSSLEQSSTTMTSAGGFGRCASALATARRTISGRLYAGMITETGSGEAAGGTSLEAACERREPGWSRLMLAIACRGGGLEHLDETLAQRALRVPRLDGGARGPAQLRAALVRLPDARRQPRRIARGDEQPVMPIRDDLRDGRDVGPHDRGAAAHRLQQRHRKALVGRGQSEHRARAAFVADAALVEREAEECDAIRHSEACRMVPQQRLVGTASE